ncbi:MULTISPECIES: DUF1120 domain-containing protein [unclassified Burkholderia]|uniref:DUF1120 domain-containing protein n=1 Tax=unclassified Burkholderia TaxID=2613784 RepID=UPI000F574F03|nr:MULTISPECIES: DUF1120 domain-containing protein [unclassified Burkholderia]RQR39565.1 DUF1120 domain-containing protein [Burkholderia sp. Bp9131]RQR65950.1 DUF1120 domain-containing protein [Burkholderia sp. Bp9015]
MQMMRHVLALTVLAFSMASTVPSRAADLSVNGHIRSDGACSIALRNGGVIDLGNLSRKDFIAGHQQIYHDMPLLIYCQHPTKVGIDVIDNRAGVQSAGMNGYAFGLGDPAIGYYVMSGYVSDGHNADGRFVRMIRRSKDETTWGEKGSGDVGLAPGYTIAWDVEGPQTEPVAFKALASGLGFRFYFRDDIAFTDELEIDGSVTLELRYL